MTGQFGDPTLPERFWSKVQLRPTGCWEWTASLSTGYGQCFIGGRVDKAHRVTYMALVGPIPEGLVLDHLCRNRACCNPEHLEPVSNKENILRGVSPSANQARRTHCRKGHPLEGENLSPGQVLIGKRGCRTCHNVAARKQWAAIRAAADALGLSYGAYGKAYGWSASTARSIAAQVQPGR
jgi:hypothetical protein